MRHLTFKNVSWHRPISCWKDRRGIVKASTIELSTAEWEVLSSNLSQGEKLLFISFFISSLILHGTVIPKEIFPSFTWKNCIPQEIFHAYQDLVPTLTIQTCFQCEEDQRRLTNSFEFRSNSAFLIEKIFSRIGSKSKVGNRFESMCKIKWRNYTEFTN